MDDVLNGLQRGTRQPSADDCLAYVIARIDQRFVGTPMAPQMRHVIEEYARRAQWEYEDSARHTFSARLAVDWNDAARTLHVYWPIAP